MDTSLHIALCDSDPGDRKQMERLLMRESDKRVNTTGVFYVDTFGGVTALISASLVYDVYFLDVTDPLCDSYEIAKAIRAKGILSPIVFCISKVDFRNSGELLSNSVFLNKPIKVSELSLVLEEVIRQKMDDYIPTIELRNNYEAYYVTENDVMYFEGKNYDVNVTLKDGIRKKTGASISMLTGDTKSFDSFICISKTAIINCNYVESVGFMSVKMKDGVELGCSHKIANIIRKRLT